MRSGFLLLWLVLAVHQSASAQSRPSYIQFDPFTVKGALYRPDSGESEIGVLLIHRVNNFLGQHQFTFPRSSRRGNDTLGPHTSAPRRFRPTRSIRRTSGEKGSC